MIVGYIAPLEGNRPAIGFDINSEPLRQDAIAEGIAKPGREIGQYDPSIYGGTALLDWRFFCLRSLGRHEEMRDTIRQALQRGPDHPRFLKRQRKWGA